MQTFDGAVAGFFVEMQNRFGVATAPIAVTGRGQLGPQLGVVVDFAVVDNPDGAVFVAHRLKTALDVDDRQAPVSQPNRPQHDGPFPVRAAVNERVPHPHETARFGTAARIEFHYAGNAAHRPLPSRSTRTPRRSTRTDSPERSKNSPAGT